ncbi:6666_t:CDS:2 [Acaulospora colombiana]|uniref:6666_t:CDS:1 n=1 Tax=Acaulospora colombiana TaxID=27376 RepID=A0ACA9M391_9GLOM|nr:6666_t:CDS:2 [Acaulospora colombiana]
MRKYQRNDNALFFTFMIICIVGIIGVETQQNVTIQLIDSQIKNGTLSSESSSNVHFMYNASFISFAFDRTGGLSEIIRRAVTTTKPVKTSTIRSSTISTSSSPIAKIPSINNPVTSNTSSNAFAKPLKVYVSEDPSNPQPGPNNYTNSYDLNQGYDTDNSTALLRIDGDIDSSSVSTYIAKSNDLRGLYNSLCALQYNQLSGVSISYNLTTRGLVYPNYGTRIAVSISHLSSGTIYTAFVVYNQLNVNNDQSTASPTFLKTKSQNNCRLISGLSFCDRVAYSVPANPGLPMPKIVDFYDNLASSQYQNFTLSVSQISNTSRYSLVRDINDCLVSYKNWVCAVTIPRCGDVDSTGITRDVNKSRVSDIDSEMVPGAYIEVPPCIDLCYNTSQSCPATLSFVCPPNNTLLYSSYGTMGPNNNASNGTNGMRCNPMGSDWVISSMAVRRDNLLGYEKLVTIFTCFIMGILTSNNKFGI